jgi:hypothetical protein
MTDASIGRFLGNWRLRYWVEKRRQKEIIEKEGEKRKRKRKRAQGSNQKGVKRQKVKGSVRERVSVGEISSCPEEDALVLHHTRLGATTRQIDKSARQYMLDELMHFCGSTPSSVLVEGVDHHLLGHIANDTLPAQHGARSSSAAAAEATTAAAAEPAPPSESTPSTATPPAFAFSGHSGRRLSMDDNGILFESRRPISLTSPGWIPQFLQQLQQLVKCDANRASSAIRDGETATLQLTSKHTAAAFIDRGGSMAQYDLVPVEFELFGSGSGCAQLDIKYHACISYVDQLSHAPDPTNNHGR